jgi:hypothetical protein
MKLFPPLRQAVLALPLVLHTPSAQAQEAPTAEAPLVLKAGEIRLEGTIESVDWENRVLRLYATSFSLPNGKTSLLPTPKIKEVRLSEDTLLYLRGAPDTQILRGRAPWRPRHRGGRRPRQR